MSFVWHWTNSHHLMSHHLWQVFFSMSFIAFFTFSQEHISHVRDLEWEHEHRIRGFQLAMMTNLMGKACCLSMRIGKREQTKLENSSNSRFFHPHLMLIPANSNSICRLTNHFTSSAASRQLVDICRSSSFTYFSFLFALLVVQLILLANCSFCTLHKLIDCWLLRADWFYMCILNQLRVRKVRWKLFLNSIFFFLFLPLIIQQKIITLFFSLVSLVFLFISIEIRRN